MQNLEDSAKFILIFKIKKKLSPWQLLFCDLKHAQCLLSAAGVVWWKLVEHDLSIDTIVEEKLASKQLDCTTKL